MARENQVRWLLWGASWLLALGGLGRVHLFDWDEINFAEAAREMRVLGDYLRVYIDYRPFWEKPPLFFWKQAAAMEVLGVGEWAARLPNALLGVIVSGVFLWRGRRWFEADGKLLWLLWWGGFLPHLYFKSGLIDPWFNAYMFFAAWAVYRMFVRGRFVPYGLVGAVLWGLAVLTKGPVALGLVGVPVAVVWWAFRRRHPLRCVHALLFGGVLVVTAASWFVVEWVHNGPWFVVEFVKYQLRLLQTPDAGHAGPWWYHFVVLFIGCFPASILVVRMMVERGFRNAFDGPWVLMLWSMLAVVLVVFSVVETKIIHYSSLAYYPIVMLAARYWDEMEAGKGWKVVLDGMMGMWGMLLALVVAAGNTVRMWRGYVEDAFAAAALTEPVDWPWYGVIVPLAIASGWWWFRRRASIQARIAGAAVAVIVWAQWTWYYALPRIERYTQGPAVDFYVSMQGRPAYVSVIGFKSYAHLFYTRKPPPPAPGADALDRLLTQPVDSPVWLVTRVDRWERVQKDYPLGKFRAHTRRGGYLFLRREE